MSHPGKVSWLIAVSALALVLVCGQAPATETGIYQAPDLSRFLLIGEEDGDGDGDGVNETHILHYKDVAGDQAFSMTTKGRLWAWSLQSSADAADPDRNFVIRDSDCDGIFDERYGLDEAFHVPDCLR